jgi:hypothetical protein
MDFTSITVAAALPATGLVAWLWPRVRLRLRVQPVEILIEE